MAQGDFTLFSPAESAFQEPGQFEASLKAEGTRKATYTSQMDQFYGELEETQRQFDIGTELTKGTQRLQKRGLELEAASIKESTRQFDLGYDLLSETEEEDTRQFDLTFGLESARLLEEGRQFDTEAGLIQAELAITGKLTDAQIEHLGAVTGLTGAQTKSSGIADTIGILGLMLGSSKLLFGSEKGGGMDIGTDDVGKAFEGLSNLGTGIYDWGDKTFDIDIPEDQDFSWP